MPKAVSETTRVASSRRQFIAAGLAATAAMAPVATLAAAPNPDSNLTKLGRELEQLYARFRAASRLATECFYRFDEIRPEIPAALSPRFDDDLNLNTISRNDKSGAERKFYSFVEIDNKLRARTEFHRYGFNGTKEQWEELGLPNWRNNQLMPLVGYEHLFFSIGDEHRKQRAAEIISAYDKWKREEDAASIQSGMTDADAAVDRVNDEMSEVVDRMLEAKPKTLADFKALATALRLHCWCNEFDEPSAVDDQLIQLMVKSLSDRADA